MYTALSERSQRRKSTYCTIPTTRHSEKGKIVELVKKISGYQERRDKGGAKNRQTRGNFWSAEITRHNNAIVGTCHTFVKTHRIYNIKNEP